MWFGTSTATATISATPRESCRARTRTELAALEANFGELGANAEFLAHDAGDAEPDRDQRHDDARAGWGTCYELNPASGGTGPLLELNGSVVTTGQFAAGWTPVGAVQTGNGYEVALSNGQSQYVVWNVGSNGNYTGAATGFCRAPSAELEGVEAAFGEGPSPAAGSAATPTTIATNGTSWTSLRLAAYRRLATRTN